MIARVRGILIFSVVPWPGVLCMSIVPPIFSMLVLTTSMPTPRPEMLVIRSAVLKPGRKINCIRSWSPIRAACSREISPRSRALRVIRSTSMPAPSSEISMLTCPLS